MYLGSVIFFLIIQIYLVIPFFLNRGAFLMLHVTHSKDLTVLVFNEYSIA